MEILSNYSLVEKYFVLYLLAINLTAFIVYGLDKLKARKKSWRIPEFNLLLLGILGGGVGSSIAMSFFKHKLSKSKFTLGVPIIIIINFISILYIINMLK